MPSRLNRRRFFQILATTSVAAGSACGCARDRHDEILLAPHDPDDEGDGTTPGVSAEYATVCRMCPAGCGMLVRVRDGRAYKAEGNPEHPVNRGTLCARGQSSLQDLYHPDRIRQPLARDSHGRLAPIGWDEAHHRFVSILRDLHGRRAAWIGRLEGPALTRLADD